MVYLVELLKSKDINCVVLYLTAVTVLYLKIWLPDPFFNMLPGGSLSDTYQGTAREGQTHLRQYVPEICRERFKGEGLCSLKQPQGGGIVTLQYC